MTHLIMIYSRPETWGHPTFTRTAEFLGASPDERDEMEGQFGELLGEISESGELVSAEPMAEPGNVRTVRVRDGAPLVTDGPAYATGAALAGVFVVECDTARAVEIASRFPDARFTAVEVRPVSQR
jgi:hypothetical protein